MEVEGVSSQALPTIQTSQTEPTVEETPQEQPQSGETTETETMEQAESDSGEIKGVIRNLLDGHFKGVADVRLRINNFEQLAIIAEENLKAAAEEKIASLLDTIDSGINNLPDSSEPLTAEGASESEDETETVTVTGLHQEFDNEVNKLNEEFQSAQTPSTDDLVIGIEGAFSVFIGALQDLLAPTVENNSSADKDVATTTDDEPQATGPTEPDYQSLLDELEDAFTTAIAELTEALNAVQILPELSGPGGNGAAYENFLAVYNTMWGIGADQDNTDGSGNVDMIT